MSRQPSSLSLVPQDCQAPRSPFPLSPDRATILNHFPKWETEAQRGETAPGPAEVREARLGP